MRLWHIPWRFTEEVRYRFFLTLKSLGLLSEARRKKEQEHFRKLSERAQAISAKLDEELKKDDPNLSFLFNISKWR
jgi:hypothetical protein